MNGKIMALVGRLAEDMDDLQRVVSRTEVQLVKAGTSNDDSYLDAVALNLHGFYSGVERLFEDVARTLEESVPAGSNWHQNLLRQMAAEVMGIRPPVISRQTRDCLDEYRGFRHMVRHVYAFKLRPSRIKELTDELRACFDMVAQDIERFQQHLIGLASNE